MRNSLRNLDEINEELELNCTNSSSTATINNANASGMVGKRFGGSKTTIDENNNTITGSYAMTTTNPIKIEPQPFDIDLFGGASYNFMSASITHPQFGRSVEDDELNSTWLERLAASAPTNFNNLNRLLSSTNNNENGGRNATANSLSHLANENSSNDNEPEDDGDDNSSDFLDEGNMGKLIKLGKHFLLFLI
jgi:hypothetical protein